MEQTSPLRVLESVEREEIELIRFLWVDHNAITRGKAVSRLALPERMVSGAGIAKVRQACGLADTAEPLPGFDAVGEVRLVPDPDSYVLLPHAPGSAAMLCDLMTVDGAPWAACPRAFLRDAISSAGELDVVAAFEPEFTLCSSTPRQDGLDLFDSSLCFDNEGFDATNDFTVELVRALRSQDMNVQLYHPEFAAGQHEMTLLHAPALRAADQSVWQRAFTRGLARRRGMWATFTPVPYPGMRGNGNHVHISLWQRPSGGAPATNLFADRDDPLGLSATGRHFIAGLLAHLPGLAAITCASVISYDRLRPGMWSGAYGGYGPDNREVAIRIPSPLRGDEAGTTNVEVKVCDSTANPYLALGALIYAGLDGIRRRLDPGEPLMEDPNRLDEQMLRRRGIERLPGSLEEAVDALEADEFLMDVLGPLRRLLYPAIKRADIRDMKQLPPDLSYYQHAIHF
jgi:glutamine synthetase